MSWDSFVEHWHEFYLMTGTAAVTLAGLLFVAISLHVDAATLTGNLDGQGVSA